MSANRFILDLVLVAAAVITLYEVGQRWWDHRGAHFAD
jgi:hypothetical protein